MQDHSKQEQLGTFRFGFDESSKRKQSITKSLKSALKKNSISAQSEQSSTPSSESHDSSISGNHQHSWFTDPFKEQGKKRTLDTNEEIPYRKGSPGGVDDAADSLEDLVHSSRRLPSDQQPYGVAKKVLAEDEKYNPLQQLSVGSSHYLDRLPPEHRKQSVSSLHRRTQVAEDVSRRPSVIRFEHPTTAIDYRNTKPSIVSRQQEQKGRLHPRRAFVSRRLREGEVIEKSWTKKRDPGDVRAVWIQAIAFVLGIAIIGVLIWNGWQSVVNNKYCPVLIDNFETLDTNTWSHEIQLGGFGTGEFDWTTASPNNSFVKDNTLYIVPTLTNDSIGSSAALTNGYTVNLTTAGTCTGTSQEDCSVASNDTTGAFIPPVQSARLTTRFSASLKFGKVEVVAKLPQGDWLWPAIWLYPVNSTYGAWPASGEIDIMESRGNDHNYPGGGNNAFSSTLHWGPDQAYDAFWRTTKQLVQTHSTFPAGYHTFGLEWSEKYIYTYLDGRLRQVLYKNFNQPFWQFGDFATTLENGTADYDPWPLNNDIAPFDQEFYLILNVAVGGTNGFFPDNVAEKPWSNTNRNMAMASFWSSVNEWLPTWPKDPTERGMAIKKVSMWRQC